MAKAQLVARFSVEVAPPQLSSSIIRRRHRGIPVTMLDTIAEEEPDAPAIVMAELSSYALLRGVAAAVAPPPPPVMVGSSSLVLVRAETKEKRCVVVVGSSASAVVHSAEKRLPLDPAPAAKAAAACSNICA
ncbi:hypothetical protein E2562_016824 [Oryza meyeriana var. granulata]|uniref:Uncharacterized protein n=1 Tax=Oryza meyeriana var. granulata TaxID=110450 RepID=A0A6G1BYR8_9ORYZ|nr:hypothetical protein E2562_016824 [Oryza meyeriana var. granulata]